MLAPVNGWLEEWGKLNGTRTAGASLRALAVVAEYFSGHIFWPLTCAAIALLIAREVSRRHARAVLAAVGELADRIEKADSHLLTTRDDLEVVRREVKTLHGSVWIRLTGPHLPER